MKGLVGALVFLVACSSSGGNDGGTDAPISPACQEATTYQNLANIEMKIFAGSCTFSGCHTGGGAETPCSGEARREDFHVGKSFATLVNFQSCVDPTRRLVVPGDAKASFLLLMIGEIKPADATPPGTDPPPTVGFMPQNSGGQFLCPEKRGAIRRWIEAGAMNN
jgi:hypothetical protein